MQISLRPSALISSDSRLYNGLLSPATRFAKGATKGAICMSGRSFLPKPLLANENPKQKQQKKWSRGCFVSNPCWSSGTFQITPPQAKRWITPGRPDTGAWFHIPFDSLLEHHHKPAWWYWCLANQGGTTRCPWWHHTCETSERPSCGWLWLRWNRPLKPINNPASAPPLCQSHTKLCD